MTLRKPKLDIGLLIDQAYLKQEAYEIAARHPEDPELSLFLGFMLGRISKLEASK